MIKQLRSGLYDAATMTFEEVAFMFESFEEQDTAQPPVAAASVAFHGPLDGRLEIYACRSFLRALASNMLGEEEVPHYAQQLDALAEIANIICGNMLPRVAGSSALFRLDAPVVSTNLPPENGAAAELNLNLDGGHVEVRVFFEEVTHKSVKKQTDYQWDIEWEGAN